MDSNSKLILLSSSLILVFMVFSYLKARGGTEIKLDEEFGRLFDILEAVKVELVEIIKKDFPSGCSAEEFDNLYKRKAQINDALIKCVYGIDSAKTLVIDLIRSFIDEKISDENVNKVLGLDDESEPADNIMFEIIMYKYKKRYGKKALAEWIKKNNYHEARQVVGSNDKRETSYYVTPEDLQQSYMEEKLELTMDERRDILAIIVYQNYRGFGLVDTLREMDINGFNMGTSGSIMQTVNSKNTEKANNAVWVYFDGKYIHFKFMDFGYEDELKRIIQLLIRFNNPGSLTAKRGYLVNTMYDKSRILALRPPASEYWAIFVRKFTLSDVSPKALIDKPYTKNAHICIKLIEYILRGEVTCAVTGRQGSGKTTLMSSIMRFINPKYTIRVLEMAPELYLRELYSTRNILSVQETSTVSATALQDALKKSDAAVSIVGEVATDAIAARMIQMGMTASIFTIFSHHANTPKDLVLTLRNSLAADGGFDNMEIAEKQVTDVVKMDIHLDYDTEGKRYISGISEIVQVSSNSEYPKFLENIPEMKEDETLEEFRLRLKLYELRLRKFKAELDGEYYYRSTDRISFKVREVLKYDYLTHTYNPHQRLSAPLENKMIACMVKDAELVEEFKYFILKYWGLRDTDDEYEENIYTGKKEDFDNYLKSMSANIDLEDEIENEKSEAENEEVESSVDYKEALDYIVSSEAKNSVASEFSIGLFKNY